MAEANEDVMDDSALDGYESDESMNDQEREELNELIDEMFESSDSEDEDFEGFVFHVGREVKWISRPLTAMPRPIPFEEYEERRDPGLQIPLDKGMSPFKLFKLFLTVGFVSNIVTWTNIHAEIKRLGGDKGPWKETNIDEIFAFLACFIIMNDFVCLPSLHSYFMTDQRRWFLHANSLGKIFSRDRFTQLKRYLWLCDPRIPNPPRGEPRHDALYRIRPLINELSKNFSEVYHPDKAVSIDETMIPFKGRFAYRQRRAMKPVRDGIKMFQLTETPSGYTWKFEIYTGKRAGEDRIAGDLGITGLLVTRLISGLEHQGYIL